jgi:hypothetical protein
MSVQPVQSAKHYARMICKHMKELPDQYANDPQDVQTALGLTDLEFNLGLDLCIQRGVIKMEKQGAPARVDKAVDDGTMSAPARPSPFAMDTDDTDETEPARPTPSSPFAMEADETGELPVTEAAKVW